MAGNDPEAGKESRALKSAKRRLAEFLKNNPDAELVEDNSSGRPILQINRPWSDDSLALQLRPDTSRRLIPALNKVFLPPPLTALYHYDTAKLEVIWTAFKLSADQEEIAGRVFEFRRNGKAHRCAFEASSDRLLLIGRASAPLKQSDTNWRNLRSFHNYALRTQADDEGVYGALDTPRSFWISDVQWDEEEVYDLLRNLNFYLKLYDFSSPTVVVHADPDPFSTNPRSRYLWDMFPSVITAKQLEPNLISYWAAAHDAASTAEQFLNFYRIVEYVAYHHVEHETRRQIKRVMSSPHLISELDKSANEVIALIRQFRVQLEGQRVASVVSETVKPEILWKEVCVNPEYFTAPTEFEGGLTLERLANEAKGSDKPPANLISNITESMTKIRNSLAHGKDKFTGDIILPTRSNMAKLKPWVHLISAVAAEVLLYEKLD